MDVPVACVAHAACWQDHRTIVVGLGDMRPPMRAGGAARVQVQPLQPPPKLVHTLLVHTFCAVQLSTHGACAVRLRQGDHTAAVANVLPARASDLIHLVA